MDYDYFDLVEKARLWAEQAFALGWVDSATLAQLNAVDIRTPKALFNDSEARPLMVAFMGGTGVGKSSLLNRLAGKAVAKTGVERPTSHEVTLFHHQEVAIQRLPDQLPMASAKLAQHTDEAKKNIVWIDMPDIDSIEQKNKHLVLAWLPHIDVLIYVVSPERYRDEKEWRLLLSEGGRHAWLFAFNQWDKGFQEQYRDFLRQLQNAGFVEPIIYKTICTNPSEPDEFKLLETTLTDLATQHTVKHLEQRNLLTKKNELKEKLQHCQRLLGAKMSFQQSHQLWREQWQKTAPILQQGFAWPIRQLAKYYADHAADLIAPANTGQHSLWDAWAQTRFDDALDEFAANTGQLEIPMTPFKKQLSALREKAPKIMQANCELSVRQALVKPGNLLQRSLLKVVRFGEIFLPMTSIGWVGYQVFTGFYNSSQTNTDYLGVDFAVHSTLLIAISWLTPFFILKKLKPSLEKSALKGLNKGLSLALNEIENATADAIKEIGRQHEAQNAQLLQMIEQCSLTEPSNPLMNRENTLTRMLITKTPLPSILKD